MYSDYIEKLSELLALEYNCTPDDIMGEGDILTDASPVIRGRNYSGHPTFFAMASHGRNTVITADSRLHPFLKDHMKSYSGYRLFELPSLVRINDELKKHGHELLPTHHMLLPCKAAEPQRSYPVKWYYDRECDPFYGDKRFTHALYERYFPERPDRIAVVALDGDNIMGMAGCSEDAPHWLQIGIDVCPEYRSKGVGTYLVTLIKNEIIRRGEVPFYGTALANYHSMKIALACGFKPTWVETGAVPLKEEKQ